MFRNAGIYNGYRRNGIMVKMQCLNSLESVNCASIIMIMSLMRVVDSSEYRPSTVGDSSESRSGVTVFLVNFMN